MSHQAESPSITQFFQPQRKRPRLGKDVGDVQTSKKLLLEDGGSAVETVEDKISEVLIKQPTRADVERPSTPKAQIQSKLVSAINKVKKLEGRSAAVEREGKIDDVLIRSPTRADLERPSTSQPISPSKLVNANNKVKKRLLDPSDAAGKKSTVPAYLRFHSLAQKTPTEKKTPAEPSSSEEELDLPLPYHFKVLKELFMAVETVLGIMKSRKETMIFPKVRTGVQELFKKISLREKHLAQMVTIFPGCYSFGLEKVGKETHIKIEVEELPPSVICARRKTFHAALVKICLEHHQKFLLGMVPPVVVPRDKQISRWHPKFKIDEIPDVLPKEDALPIKPTPDKISSAREVIAKAQNILEYAHPRMKQAVKNMLNNTADADVAAATDNSKNIQQTARLNPKQIAAAKALKGVSSSLLEKIRNREREKLLNEMTRSPAECKKLQMTKKMPEFIKIIRNMMVADKKVALPMETVVDRIANSVQKMSYVDTDTHVRLLVTLLPNWAKIHKLSHSSVEYVKIDKSADINVVLSEMNDIIKNLSS